MIRILILFVAISCQAVFADDLTYVCEELGLDCSGRGVSNVSSADATAFLELVADFQRRQEDNRVQAQRQQDSLLYALLAAQAQAEQQPPILIPLNVPYYPGFPPGFNPNVPLSSIFDFSDFE